MNQWHIVLRDRAGRPSCSRVNRCDFAEAASDAYLLRNNLNSMNDKGWKIESIVKIEKEKEVE